MAFTQLGPEDPPAVQTILAKHRLVLSAEHAGRAVPTSLGDLGVGEADQQRHVWYDIGMDRVPSLVRQRLGCSLVEATYSRLVLDVNRHPSDATAIPQCADQVSIPANRGLSDAEIAARHQAFHVAYHAGLGRVCDTIAQFDPQDVGGPPLLVSLHSMTDRLASDPTPRPWQITFLHNEDTRLASALRDWFGERGFATALNQPYDAHGKTGFTLYAHGYARGWLHAAVEIRQDLLSTEKACATWADHLADAFKDLMERL